MLLKLVLVSILWNGEVTQKTGGSLLLMLLLSTDYGCYCCYSFDVDVNFAVVVAGLLCFVLFYYYSQVFRSACFALAAVFS